MTNVPTLDGVLRDSSIVLCCGTGGVGKTTTAASIAMHGARSGRRSVVVTIDPAKRLADALGLEGLTNTPSQIDGDWSGELWALMLDTKTTFDELVARNATDAAQVERILGNRFYRNISGRLSGTQEYMAMEKLYELHEESRFDLVVVDTPPTRNALDFLDAPRRLTRFLDHRLYRILMTPGRAYVQRRERRRAGVPPHGLEGRRRRRRSTTRSRSSRRSKGWRRAFEIAPNGCSQLLVGAGDVVRARGVTARRHGRVRPRTSPTGWPKAASRCPRSS